MTSPSALSATQLWRDAAGMPEVLDAVVSGFASPDAERSRAVAIARSGRRLVGTGNGAAFYSALALEAAARTALDQALDAIAVPAGVIAGGGFRWRDGDVPVVFSTSGELRDIVRLAQDEGVPSPWLAVTATAGSFLGTASSARIDVPVFSQLAVTHTQSYVANVLSAYLLWEAVTGRRLSLESGTLAVRMREELARAEAWAPTVLDRIGDRRVGVAFAGGAGWSAALQTALVLKEVSGLAIEGLETREAATTGMYALDPDSLVFAHPGGDLEDEAEEICAGRGAVVVRFPRGGASALEQPILGFPAALAFSVALGLRRGRDVDAPEWAAAYYGTARVLPPGASGAGPAAGKEETP